MGPMTEAGVKKGKNRADKNGQDTGNAKREQKHSYKTNV